MTTAVAFTDVSLEGKTLTADQLWFFNENGYIVLKGLLTPREVDALKQLRDRASKRAEEVGGSFRDGPAHYDVEKLAGDPTGKTLRLRKIQEVFKSEPVFRDMLSQDKLLDAVEDLIGPNIYYHSSKLMCKPARGGRRKPWHQDYAYWATMNTRQVTVWIAIDQATKENGCMQVIPGSHRRGLIEHHQLEDFQIDEAGIEKENIVFAEMEPGDVLIFSVLTLHASDTNHSPNPRLSAIIDFDSEPAPTGSALGSNTPLRSR
ncbi:MAG: phytanoyl-CoA dioxygenase family protein [Phycisphaeraceae bacterium]|nr:phytanoyl-CoA dioxygenase family protein [Phycisphaeraceae bacterium]